MPDSSVLVIEAGPYAPYEDRINIPGMKGSTLGTKYDWNFTSIPQDALLGRTITQSRGKVLGGTSALNLLIWDRASKPEYDAWEQLGNPGWNWDNMIKAMNKAENFSNPGPPIYTGNTGYGVAGPINAVVDRYIPKQEDPWIPTLENLDVSFNSEWLDGENVGVAYHSSAIDPTHYNRSYSAVEYLPLAGMNLDVLMETEVARIDLASHQGRYKASGVTLLDGNTIRAKKEVILSGGTIKNPQLLELSGIGNADVLQAVGVEQLIDLPGVGENLQDHPRCQVVYQLKDGYTSLDKLRTGHPNYSAHQLALWEAGKYSQYDFATSAYSYQNWSSFPDGVNKNLVKAAKQVTQQMDNVVDNKKLEFLTNETLSPGIAQAEIIFSDGYFGSKGYPAEGSALYGKQFSTLIGGVMHPLARGTVHVNSSDPTVHPVYDPAFASNEYDFQALLAMMRWVRTIAHTSPFRDVWVSEYEPGLDVVPLTNNEAEWETYVRNNTNTFYHPVGTCAMLPKADGGVVDPQLMVYGTSNLRIIDASVIPMLLSAHPQTGIYGIAERAGEIIAGCWQ